jgi:hypothetical protein
MNTVFEKYLSAIKYPYPKEKYSKAEIVKDIKMI